MDGRPYLQYLREPLIHSGITDLLPDDHPLAYTSISCQQCGGLLHAFNNECMQTWVETGKGNFCLSCFVKLYEADEGEDARWGLPLIGKEA
jgi:hypothetical protein